MKVKAKKRGFFGGIYYTPNDGKVFEVTEAQFSRIWMEKVDGRKSKKADKPKVEEPVKKAEDVRHEPLEIPSLMPEFNNEAS